MTRHRLLIFTAALTLAACESATATRDAPLPSYFKDHRTNLCFAAVSSDTKDGWKVVSIAQVPCDAVPPSMLRSLS